MIVAMGIVSFILVVLIQMVDATSQAWNSGTRRVDAFREARAALHIIEHDFAGMKTDWYSTADLTNPALFKKNLNGLPMILDDAVNITGIDMKGTPKERTAAMFFLSTTADLTKSPSERTAEDGDVGTVGYYVAFSEDGSAQAGANGRKIFKLYRFFRPSKETFDTTYAYLTDPTVTQKKFLAGSAASKNLTAHDGNEPLAFNVTDFSIKAYYYDKTGNIQVFSAEEAAKPIDRTVPGFDPATAYPPRPDFVEITLGVLGNQSVAKLGKNQVNDWNRTPVGSGIPNDLAGRVVSQEARVFTTRINCN